MIPSRNFVTFVRIATVFALMAAVVPVRPLGAQDGQDSSALEARLPTLSGVDRVRALARLCEAYRSTAPERALEFGNQALSLADAYPDTDAQVRALNESAWALMELGRYEEAMAQARKGEALANRSSLRRGEARALNNQGVIERRLGAYAEALKLFSRSEIIYQDVGDDAGVATSLNNVSVVLGFDLGDYAQALASQLKALEIRERMGRSDALYQSYNTLGVIYDNMGKREEAVRYLNEALEGWRSLDRKPRMAASLSNLAEVYTKAGDMDRALSLQQEALGLRRDLSNPSGVAVSLENIGTILTRMGRLEEARQRLDSSLTIRRRLGEKKNTAASLLGLAQLDRRTGRYTDGEARVQEALRIASDISARDTERAAYEELAALREAEGDAAGALAAFKEGHRLDKALFDETSTRRVEALKAEFEADRAQREIDRLKAEASLATARGERRGTLLIVAVLLAFVVFLLYRRRVVAEHERELSREVERRTAELSEANAQLRDLSLTDALTGLRNRRYVFHTIATDLAASIRAHGDARREGTAPESADLMFYMLDLDDFKSVNDEFGHASGDMVLEQVARLLEGTARASDIVIRWGGEEFLVLSRQAERKGASAFAERLRQSVGEHEFRCEGGRMIRRTCSVGFAAFPFVPTAPEKVSWEVVLGLADQAAYVAKRSGRDAWVGVACTSTTDPGAVSASGSVVGALVRSGALEVVSSLEEDGREVDLAGNEDEEPVSVEP